jgi:hypothetical protein
MRKSECDIISCNNLPLRHCLRIALS